MFIVVHESGHDPEETCLRGLTGCNHNINQGASLFGAQSPLSSSFGCRQKSVPFLHCRTEVPILWQSISQGLLSSPRGLPHASYDIFGHARESFFKAFT